MRNTIAIAIVTVVAVPACTEDPGSLPQGSDVLSVTEVPPLENPEEYPFVRPAPEPWDRAVLTGDGQTILIRYLGGACSGASHVNAQYRSNRIVLTLFLKVLDLPKGHACPAIGIPKTVTVTLSQPVSGRPIVDGAPDDR